MLDNNNKVNYVEYETAITAKNLNDIQESILKNQEEIKANASQLEHNTKYINSVKRSNIYRLKELGCIQGTFKSIKDVFKNVTLEDVKLIDQDATLENSHVWYIIQKLMIDNVTTPVTIIIDGYYYIDRTIELTMSKTIIGVSKQQQVHNTSNNSVLYKIGVGDLFTINKYNANSLYLCDFGAVGENKSVNCGDFLSIKRSLNGFTINGVNVSIFRNGIRKYSGHTVCGLIEDSKFNYCQDNCIHLKHLGNDSQVNQVNIINCVLSPYCDVFQISNERDQIINEEYGNGLCISGSGCFIDNIFTEGGICGINLTGAYKKGLTIKGVYSEDSKKADIYVPSTDYNIECLSNGAFNVINPNYISKGIFIGDIKVENYNSKSINDIVDRFYTKNNLLLLKNDFKNIKIRYKSSKILDSIIPIYQHKLTSKIDINKTYFDTPQEATKRRIPLEYNDSAKNNIIYFSPCDIKEVTIDSDNKNATIYFHDFIELGKFLNLGNFEFNVYSNNITNVFTNNFSAIDVSSNSITFNYAYQSYAQLFSDKSLLTGYVYTWSNTSISTFNSNVSIANNHVKLLQQVSDGYIYEINVNRVEAPDRFKTNEYHKPDFYTLNFDDASVISDVVMYKS